MVDLRSRFSISLLFNACIWLLDVCRGVAAEPGIQGIQYHFSGIEEKYTGYLWPGICRVIFESPLGVIPDRAFFIGPLNLITLRCVNN